jgi:hypothetical protein
MNNYESGDGEIVVEEVKDNVLGSIRIDLHTRAHARTDVRASGRTRTPHLPLSLPLSTFLHFPLVSPSYVVTTSRTVHTRFAIFRRQVRYAEEIFPSRQHGRRLARPP